MQGVTRNPLADPGILGVNAGAALCVVLGIYAFGVGSVLGYVWFAFFGAAVAGVVVYAIGSLGREGATPIKLALSGAALAAVLTSITTSILLVDTAALNTYRFWAVGSLAGPTGDVVRKIWPFVVVGTVMALVTGNDEGKRAHTDRLAARSTAPPPRVGVEGTEQGQRRGARGAQLAHQIGEGPRIELRDGDVGILVESGERRLVSARDPQGAIGHDALDVGEMPDHFLDAPFAARVAVHRGVVGKAVEHGCRLLDLRGAHRDGIELRDPLDVADEVRRDFIGFGTSDRTGRHAGFPPSSVSAIAFTVLLSPVRMRRW